MPAYFRFGLIYDLGHVFFFLLFKLLFGYKVYGTENIPKSGPVIFASNHASFLDPPLIAAGIWRRVNFAGRDNLFKKRWVAFILRQWGTIPISRERLDKAMLKSLMVKLKAGEILCVYPEGTRSPDENLQPGKPGIGFIVSMMKGVPVVPVYIMGSWMCLGKKHKSIRPTPISVEFGKPVYFDHDGRESGIKGNERYQMIADSLMAEIEKLKNSRS